MYEMNRRKAAKLIVQAVAAGFGAFGLLWVYCGLHFAVTGLRDTDRFQVFCMTPIFLLMGGIFTVVAWQTLRRFGPKAIKDMVLIIALFAYGSTAALLDQFLGATQNLEKELYQLAAVIMPLVLAWLLYRILSKTLIEITKAEDIQHQGTVDTVARRE